MIGSGSLMKTGNIKFLAVARVHRYDIVASQVMTKTDSPEQFHTAVRDVLAAPDFAQKIVPGGRHCLSGDVNEFNFTVDSHNIAYIAITSKQYPRHLVFKLISDLVIQFQKMFAEEIKTCSSGSLSSKARPLFESLTRAYDDPTKLDKLAKIHIEVDAVTMLMEKNVRKVLGNIDQLSKIEEESERLKHSAGKFHQASRALSRREWLNKWATTALIVVGVVIVVTIIVLVAVV